MGKERLLARALSRSERAQVKAAIKAGDELGYNRNYTRGLVKFGQEGMTPEARMARAREIGFDTSKPVYHGTPDSRGLRAEGFKTMQERMGSDDPTRTFFAADDPRVAKTYADDSRAWDYQNATPEVLPLYLRSESPATVDWNGRPFRGREADGTGYTIRDRIDQARDAGNDQVVIRNVVDTYDAKGKPSTIRAFFDPSAARLTSATFDPARAHRRDLLAGVVPVAAAGGAGALAMQPQEAEAAQPMASPALARALAREAPRFNAALDTSLDVASFFDPSMGYATETARALKDLPGKVGPAGAVALAPLTGATEALGSIGQLPELGVAGGRAIARALARAPQPRGSQTYRKRK